MFLVRGAARDMQPIGEKQLRAVPASPRRGLSVQRGVDRRVIGGSVRKCRGGRAVEGAVGGVWSRRFRSRADVDRIFREEARVGDSRKQLFSRRVLLGYAVNSRVEK